MGDKLETLCGKISCIGREDVGITISEGDVATDREKGLRCLASGEDWGREKGE
jgi:hypothetical protein